MSKPGEVHVDLSEEQWATVKAALDGEIARLEAENARLQERVEAAERERKTYWECYRRACAVYRCMKGCIDRYKALAERRKKALESLTIHNRKASLLSIPT